MLQSVKIQTSFGELRLIIWNESIIRLLFQNDNPIERDYLLCELINNRGEVLNEYPSHPVADAARQQLKEYAEGKRKRFEVPYRICLVQNLVEKAAMAMQRLPYGKTFTYKELADWIGCNSIRASATAIGKNPLPILIPCHRIIASSGELGGYRGGLELKRILLTTEGILPSE